MSKFTIHQRVPLALLLAHHRGGNSRLPDGFNEKIATYGNAGRMFGVLHLGRGDWPVVCLSCDGAGNINIPPDGPEVVANCGSASAADGVAAELAWGRL